MFNKISVHCLPLCLLVCMPVWIQVTFFGTDPVTLPSYRLYIRFAGWISKAFERNSSLVDETPRVWAETSTREPPQTSGNISAKYHDQIQDVTDHVLESLVGYVWQLNLLVLWMVFSEFPVAVEHKNKELNIVYRMICGTVEHIVIRRAGYLCRGDTVLARISGRFLSYPL